MAAKNETPGNRRLMVSTGVSVVLGILVGQMFDFENQGKLHFVSITGRGPMADAFVIVSVILMVVGALGMTSAIRAVILIILGTVLVLAPLVGPSIVAWLSPNARIDTQTRSSFLFLSMVEFIGACLLGSGLRRVLSHKQSRPSSPEVGTKSQ